MLVGKLLRIHFDVTCLFGVVSYNNKHLGYPNCNKFLLLTIHKATIFHDGQVHNTLHELQQILQGTLIDLTQCLGKGYRDLYKKLYLQRQVHFEHVKYQKYKTI